MRRRYHCSACGGVGHNRRVCDGTAPGAPPAARADDGQENAPSAQHRNHRRGGGGFDDQDDEGPIDVRSSEVAGVVVYLAGEHLGADLEDHVDDLRGAGWLAVEAKSRDHLIAVAAAWQADLVVLDGKPRGIVYCHELVRLVKDIHAGAPLAAVLIFTDQVRDETTRKTLLAATKQQGPLVQFYGDPDGAVNYWSLELLARHAAEMGRRRWKPEMRERLDEVLH